jgi:hypothetical protein
MVYTQKEKKTLDSLVKEINTFDMYYEMSDSSKVISDGFNTQNQILEKLKKLTTRDHSYIYMELNLNGKQSWERYFKTN